MHTLVQTPQQIFGLPQHLVVPLFQRSYVWIEEDQLAPLWSDIRRLTELRMKTGNMGASHFLGAVVLQQQMGHMGALSTFAVIDGQQRLTTLQLLMDAAEQVLRTHEQEALSQQLNSLTHNPDNFGLKEADLLKVQHTNKDRAAFHEVMNVPSDLLDGELQSHGTLIAKAHRFFVAEIRAWLVDGGDISARGSHLVSVLAQGLQIVTITLQPDEDSQEIFETLNARGTPLTAADLIKNFIFQRIEAEGGSAQKAYADRWSLFEHPFWEQEIGVGANRATRISLFLNHWLVAKRGEELGQRSTFAGFKAWKELETDRSMTDVLAELHAQARLYQEWVQDSLRTDGDVSQEAFFVYRTQAAGTEVVKPVLLWLHDAQRGIPEVERRKVISVVESWIMRRALLRLPASDLSRLVAGLMTHLSGVEPDSVGAAAEQFLRRQSRRNSYWPGDDEIIRELQTMPVYRRMRRSLIRAFLETVEDAERGYAPGRRPWAGMRVPRDTMAIEHILPQQWRRNWPVEGGLAAELNRDEHVHLIGNLTLLTSSLNSSVSNSGWSGRRGKQAALRRHDVTLMTRRLHDESAPAWSEEAIDDRSRWMTELLLQVWPVPEGHEGKTIDAEPVDPWALGVRDLVAMGLLNVGDVLVGRTDRGHTAVVGEQGILVAGGKEFSSPSGAAQHVRGKRTGGWRYWTLPDGRSLKDLKEQAVRRLADRSGGSSS